jgi:hypothetical protein
MFSLSSIMTLIGALGGGGLRLIPEIITAWNNRHAVNNAVELAQVELERARVEYNTKLEVAKLGVENLDAVGRTALERAKAQAMVIAQQAQAQLTGVKWADALNLSVRPITTFFMLALYVCFKLIVIRDAVIQAAGPSTATVVSLSALIWNEDDAAIFSGILSYWFADSAISRRKKAEPLQ